MSFGKLNDVEGIRLRRREGDGTIPRIPEICADVFGSSVRPRLMELCISQDDLLISRPTHRQHIALAIKASKARLSDGRRRPPAAQHDRRDKEETILWRRLRSGPVIIVAEAERDPGSLFFGLSYRSQVSFGKLNDVEGIRLRRREGDGTNPRIP